jgi:hypothetical protein
MEGFCCEGMQVMPSLIQDTIWNFIPVLTSDVLVRLLMG